MVALSVMGRSSRAGERPELRRWANSWLRITPAGAAHDDVAGNRRSKAHRGRAVNCRSHSVELVMAARHSQEFRLVRRPGCMVMTQWFVDALSLGGEAQACRYGRHPRC